LKKIKLLLENFYLKDDSIYKNDKLFYSYKLKFDYPKFSIIVLAAKKFNKEGILNIIKIYNQKEIYEYIFVVGKDDNKNWILENLNILNGKVVLNPNPNDVLYTTIKIGLKVLSENIDYIILQFSTLSNIKKETVDLIIERVKKSKKEIFIPIYENKKGHPIIFKKTMKKILCNLRKEKGLPYLLKKYKDKIEYIEVFDPGVVK
jgi:molybdenum cofactor cytidylyltransferase